MEAVTRVEDPEFFISRSFDLSAPRLVLRTVENIFQSTSGPAFPPLSILPYLHFFGTFIGLVYGMDDHGRLYGPIGGLIGAVLGYFITRMLCFQIVTPILTRLSLPQAMAQAISAGRYPSALNLAERLWTLKMETDPDRIARYSAWRYLIRFRDLLLGQNYSAPAPALAANLLGAVGILHETLNQPQAALLRYQRALGFFPDHAYLLYISLGLLERHPDLDRDQACLTQSLRFIQRQRHSYARFIFVIYHDLIARLFPELCQLPQPAPLPETAPAPGESSASPAPGLVSLPSSPVYPTDYFIRLIENPGEPLAGGLMVVEGEMVSVIRLAPMTFSFVRYLAAAMREEIHLRHPAGEQGWVSIQELGENLSHLAPEATLDATVKLAEKLWQQLRESGVRPELIEQNSRRSYRLAADPAKIILSSTPSGKI